MATHSSVLAWKIPWRGDWRAIAYGVARVGRDLVTKQPPPPEVRILPFSLLRTQIQFLIGELTCKIMQAAQHGQIFKNK